MVGSRASTLKILEPCKPTKFSRENVCLRPRTRLLASHQADMTALRRFGYHALLFSLFVTFNTFTNCGVARREGFPWRCDARPFMIFFVLKFVICAKTLEAVTRIKVVDCTGSWYGATLDSDPGFYHAAFHLFLRSLR